MNLVLPNYAYFSLHCFNTEGISTSEVVTMLWKQIESNHYFMECYKMVNIRPIFILSANICSINSALYTCQKCFKSSTFNNALLEKRGHIVLHLSIGLSVGP